MVQASNYWQLFHIFCTTLLVTVILISTFWRTSLHESYKTPLKFETEPQSSYKGSVASVLNSASVWPFYLKTTYPSNLREIDISDYNEMERSYLSKYLPRMIDRAERVSTYCSKIKAEESHSKWENFLWFTLSKNPIVYMPIHKVASTTMSANFLHAYYYNVYNSSSYLKNLKLHDKRIKQRTAFRLFAMPKLIKKRIRTFMKSTRVMVVRHPFARLLSSFKYHHHVNKTKKKLLIFLFRKFVNHILHPEKRNKNSMEYGVGGTYLTQSQMCDVCLTDPTVIIKLETFDEDIKFLAYLEDIKALKENFTFPKSVRHPTQNENKFDFFGALKPSQIDSLYDFYLEDFLMFNYTYEDFFNKIK